jgi:hypothetical protein
MALHSIAPGLKGRDRTYDLFAATAAKRLAGLDRTTTPIAEHSFPPYSSENSSALNRAECNTQFRVKSSRRQ